MTRTNLTKAQTLTANLALQLDQTLTEQLVVEFVSAEKRFVQRDWEPAELDGGQFCEILSRILYIRDSGNQGHSKGVDECIKYLDNDSVPHRISPRSDAQHLGRVIRTIYKIRSARGAAHISPTYTPNQMDAKLVIECIRWCMSETLRIFWTGDREVIAHTIREIIEFDVPVIGVYEDRIIVQRTDLKAEEELLIILHFGGDIGFSRNEIGKAVQASPSTVTRLLQKLVSKDYRQVVQLSNGNYRLTDLGNSRLRSELSNKLVEIR